MVSSDSITNKEQAPGMCFPVPFCTGWTCHGFTKGEEQSGIITLAILLPRNELLLSSRLWLNTL